VETGAGGSGTEPGGFTENVQKAIDDLRAAGEKATGDVRSGIDSAVAHLRDASDSASAKAQDQVATWRETLEKATDDIRRELGRLAVRSQTSDDALDELAGEVEQQRRTLSGEEATPGAPGTPGTPGS